MQNTCFKHARVSVLFESNKQANKQTNKQTHTHKQTNKQENEQTNKHGKPCCTYFGSHIKREISLTI